MCILNRFLSFLHVYMSDSLRSKDCIARQAPLSMGFSRQEFWSGLPCPPPGDLPSPGIEPTSLRSPEMAGGFFTTSATWEAQYQHYLGHHAVVLHVKA